MVVFALVQQADSILMLRRKGKREKRDSEIRSIQWRQVVKRVR